MLSIPSLNLEPIAQCHLYVKHDRKLDVPNPESDLSPPIMYILPYRNNRSIERVVVSLAFLML
jgi:hypothetical protein